MNRIVPLILNQNDIFFAGKALPETVKMYSSKLSCLTKHVSEQNLKTYTDFFFSTFMTHYKLYQYVFTKEQEKLSVKMDLPVEVPDAPLAFKDGKDIGVWEYQKKIEAIEEREKIAKKERQEKVEKTQLEDKLALSQEQDDIDNTPAPIERQVNMQKNAMHIDFMYFAIHL